MIEPRVAFDSILTSKSQLAKFYYRIRNVFSLIHRDENCQFFQILTALGLGFLGCTEIYTPSLSLTGFKRAQLFPSSPSLGPRSFATRSRKGLVLEKMLYFMIMYLSAYHSAHTSCVSIFSITYVFLEPSAASHGRLGRCLVGGRSWSGVPSNRLRRGIMSRSLHK